MDTLWKSVLWQQLGAAIDMLENALIACPDELSQLNLVLRQTIDSSPAWVARAKS